MKAKAVATQDFQKVVTRATEGFARVRSMRSTIKLVEEQLENVPDSLKKDVIKIGKTLKDTLDKVEKLYFAPKDLKGINRNADNLQEKLYDAYNFIGSNNSGISANGLVVVQKAKLETQAIVDQINKILATIYVDYQQKSEAVKYSLFKKIEPVK
jgi:hypothetical protein